MGCLSVAHVTHVWIALIHGLLMGHPCLDSTDPWVAHRSPITDGFVVLAHGSPMGRSWVIHGLPTHGYKVLSHGSPMGPMCLECWPTGNPMDHSWVWLLAKHHLYETPTGRPRISRRFRGLAGGSPLGRPCLTQGSLMGLPWVYNAGPWVARGLFLVLTHGSTIGSLWVYSAGQCVIHGSPPGFYY